MVDYMYCGKCRDEMVFVDNECSHCGLSKHPVEIDEVSGAEIPKKCCENCKHLEYVNHVDACCFLFQGTIFDDDSLMWKLETDFCSRYEFKKDKE